MDDLARLETDGWELENAVHRHEAAPATFWIPAENRRRGLQVGQAAKLLLSIRVYDEDGNSEILSERMWVYVTNRQGNAYEGRLQNRSAVTPDLLPGTVVHFLPEHVADIEDPPADYEPA